MLAYYLLASPDCSFYSSFSNCEDVIWCLIAHLKLGEHDSVPCLFQLVVALLKCFGIHGNEVLWKTLILII